MLDLALLPAVGLRRASCVLPALLVGAFASRGAEAQVVSGFLGPDPGGMLFELPDQPEQSVGPWVFEVAGVGSSELAMGEAATVSLSGSALALALGARATAVPGGGPNLQGGADGLLVVVEDLSVASATLPAGTPVTVRVRWRIAFQAAVAHTLAPILPAQQDAFLALRAEVIAVTPPTEQFHVSRWLRSLDTGAEQVTGLFASPGGFAEIVVQTTVGASFQLVMELEANAQASAAPSAALLPDAFAGGTVALVLGVAADDSAVAVLSSSLGGSWPGLANASPAHAASRLLPVPVPEAAASGSAGVALLAVALLARRRRAGRRA